MHRLGRCFADSYFEAREKFLDAAARRGAQVHSFRNPVPGPGGKDLFTDVARLGPANASKVLIVQSATHGIEGYAGSGVQVYWLQDFQNLPGDTALLFVHALNPYGFAYTRRFNEDNVDLNRSFIDRSLNALPENPGYDELAAAILPKEWTKEARREADEKVAAYAEQHGERAVMFAYKQGQYKHPNGLYYGGQKATWSGETVKAICATQLQHAKKAALIDIHTGLGAYGYGDALTTCSDVSEEGRRAIAWYGKVSCTKASGSSYSGSGCTIIEGYMMAAPHLQWTPIGLEFGTWEPEEVRDAVRADGWLHAHGGPDHPLAKRIKGGLRNAFYPGDPAWRTMVLDRGVEVITHGLAGLAAWR